MSATREYPDWMGKMRALNADEIQEFLDGPIVARIATVDSKGDPYVTPVWQEWDGDAMWIIPRAKTIFAQHLIRFPRCSVSCAKDSSPYTRVLFRGGAEIVEGPALMHDEWLEIGRRMSVRFLGERGPEYSGAVSRTSALSGQDHAGEDDFLGRRRVGSEVPRRLVRYACFAQSSR